MDAVGPVGGPGGDFVQEDHLPLPFLDPHTMRGQRRQPFCQRGQFVVVGREKRARFRRVVQVFDAGPGDGKAVESGRAAPGGWQRGA